MLSMITCGGNIQNKEYFSVAENVKNEIQNMKFDSDKKIVAEFRIDYNSNLHKYDKRIS